MKSDHVNDTRLELIEYFEVQKEPFTEQFPYVIKNGRAVLKQSPEINL